MIANIMKNFSTHFTYARLCVQICSPWMILLRDTALHQEIFCNEWLYLYLIIEWEPLESRGGPLRAGLLGYVTRNLAVPLPMTARSADTREARFLGEFL